MELFLENFCILYLTKIKEFKIKFSTMLKHILFKKRKTSLLIVCNLFMLGAKTACHATISEPFYIFIEWASEEEMLRNRESGRRRGEQYRERMERELHSNTRYSKWTPEEDKALKELYGQCGPRWGEIAARILPNEKNHRTNVQCRKRMGRLLEQAQNDA
jgi:hypothetical protein